MELHAVFVQFAALSLPWTEYAKRVSEARISQRVKAQNVKYLGWSAGANLACPRRDAR